MDIEFNDDAMSKSYDDSLANALDSEPESAPEVEEEPEAVEAEGEESTEDVQEPQEPEPLEAPARWSADDKATFANLPREAQEIVLKREADVNKLVTQKTQELAERSRTYQQLEEIIAPRRQAFAMDGMTESQAIGQLFALSDFAGRDPAGFIRWFAQARGVDLGTRSEEPESSTDPALQAIHQELAQLKAERQQEYQARQQHEQQSYVSQVDTFRNEMDEQGNLRYPHFESVRNHMAALIRSEAASTLADAYEQAVYANPETRKAVMEAERKAEEAKREAERKAKAKAAERTAGTRIRTANGQFAPASRSIDDTLSAVYDSMNG